MQEDYLTHYGVKGMRWGVRKQKSSSKRKKRSNARKNYKQKVSSRRKNKYRDINNLTDAQLRARINRMQMERQYANLLRDQKYAVAVGKNASDNILARNGNQVANQALKKGMRKAIKLA